MTDEQFDDLARGALAFEAGPPSQAIWNRIRPAPVQWFPTVREVLFCGCTCALALLLLGLRVSHREESAPTTNKILQSAMRDETRSVLASVTRITGM